MEIVRRASITTLSNSGVQSEQLLFPENSSSRRVTITRVTVEPGAVNPPHRHVASEQIWVALEATEYCYWITNAPSHSPPEMWSGLRVATCTASATPAMCRLSICQSLRLR